jgi:isoaspartyl peptidase/L-asparaginase-like protein (Ntn-hydrolase superfamily)
VGQGAEKKALSLDPSLETRDPSYFAVKTAYDQNSTPNSPPHGTVGAVALDQQGNLVAATSTGGYPGKIPGRIGDSPIVGAGTFANRDVAISCTGIGEYFMRYNIAQTIAQRMRYLGESLDLAAKNTFDEAYAEEGLKNIEIDLSCLKDKTSSDYFELKKILTKLNTLGMGGVIGIDKHGNIIEYFKFSAFARGHRTSLDPSAVVRLDGPIDRSRNG